MVTTVDEKIAARVGKFAFFDVLNPGAIDADRNVVFCFACHCAGVTANALALVDYESILRHTYSLWLVNIGKIFLAISV